MVVAIGFRGVTLSQPARADYSMTNYSYSAGQGPNSWGDDVTGSSSPTSSGGAGKVTAGTGYSDPAQNQSVGSSSATYTWSPSYSGEAPKDYKGTYQYAYQADAYNAGTSAYVHGNYSGYCNGGTRYGDYRIQYGTTTQSGVTVESLDVRRPGGQTVTEYTSTFMGWHAESYSGHTFSLQQQGLTSLLSAHSTRNT